MTHMWKIIPGLLVLGLAFGACATKGVATSQTPNNQASTASLKFTAPPEWIVEKTSSSMRVAQYKLPSVTGDEEDASLVIYYFGQGQGGTTAANIERWVGQMQQPDGSSSKRSREGQRANNQRIESGDYRFIRDLHCRDGARQWSRSQ